MQLETAYTPIDIVTLCVYTWSSLFFILDSRESVREGIARTELPQVQTVDIAELIKQTLRKCSIPAGVTVRTDSPGTLASGWGWWWRRT
jgi:hypothetical protein